ncbi:MAG: heavy metal translocating P-type ATPase [Brevinema sp.]
MSNNHEANACCGSGHDHDEQNLKKDIIKASIAFTMVTLGIVLETFHVGFFMLPYVSLVWFLIAYVLVMSDIFISFIKLVRAGDFFNEVTLMTTASVLAFLLGLYAEGAGIMVFYFIGELFEETASGNARKNIRALLEVRPDTAYVVDGDNIIPTKPEEIPVGTIIEIKTGERVPLDGLLLSPRSGFNTAALTGESVPRSIDTEGVVLAGMISEERTIRIKTTKIFTESTLARILQMVENAAQNKAPTETFMRKFSHIYTPVVAIIALLIVVLPFIYSLSTGQVFDLNRWVYTACIVLVISCPCAFVISVPLGYFGGIGLAARNGILFKGGNHLEAITNLKYLITDKTGTMTDGIFTVQHIHCEAGMTAENLLAIVAGIELKSNHPIARAICDYAKKKDYNPKIFADTQEISGHGLKSTLDGKEVLVGNASLMQKNGVSLPETVLKTARTSVFCAIDGVFVGSLVLSDEIKKDAKATIKLLHQYGVTVIMLSGDQKEIVSEVAKEIGIDMAYGELLPDGKAEFVSNFKKNHKGIIAFTGDGINDAPVLALSDIGISMGTIGSDLAIETSDVVIQTDEPSKIVSAMNAARVTRTIVMQNIILAFVVKFAVMALAIGSLANLWEGIFADVGVSIIAIFNSIRIQGKNINPRL